MRKLIFALLLLAPCLAYSQEEDSGIQFVTPNDSLYERAYSIALEKSYMTRENWVDIYHPKLGSVRFSDLGYLEYRDSTENVTRIELPCGVYEVIQESIEKVFQQEYYWFSRKHYEQKQLLQRDENLKGGNATFFATVNGKEFTVNASPEYILETYSKVFKDAVLVAKIPRGEGKIVTHN